MYLALVFVLAVYFLPNLSDGTYVMYDVMNQDDYMAESYCAAMSPAEHWVFAVRRSCEKISSCKAICENLVVKEIQTEALPYSCIGSLHIYPQANTMNPAVHNVVRLKMFRYSIAACTAEYCGPNFCCCATPMRKGMK